MKPINLTEIQKSRILEMCSLFNIYELPNSFQDIIFIKKKSNKLGENIHWYEFVINHLADKVFQMKSLSPIHLMNQKKKFGADIMCGIDPIIYLYQIFKETKNEII